MSEQLPPYPNLLKSPDWEGYDYRNLPKPEEVTADKDLKPIFSIMWDWWDYVSYYIAADDARGIYNPVMVATKDALRTWLENAKKFIGQAPKEPERSISEVLHDSYDKHCASCLRIGVTPLDYATFLETQIEYIRDKVEPLRYAVRQGLQGRVASSEPISAGEYYMYQDDEFYLELGHLQSLVTAIMDDEPPFVFPGYNDD